MVPASHTLNKYLHQSHNLASGKRRMRLWGGQAVVVGADEQLRSKVLEAC